MKQASIVALGDSTFTIQPMKLGALRQIWDVVDAAEGVHPFDRAVAIIKAGLAPDYPAIDVDALLDSGIDIKQLYSASTAILAVAGLVETPPTGEAPAGATASTGV